MRHWFVVLAIVLFASLLRLWQLNSLPPSLNWDEVSLGYNAYSVLQTAKDEWGQRLPLSFRAYGDYKLPGYVYASIPFIAFIGLNEIGIRLLSSLSGIAAVIFIYFLVAKVTGNRVLALISMFVIAVSPWHIILSRLALEANLSLTLTIAGVLLFIYGLNSRMPMFLSALILGMTLFTYNSSRVVTPLLLVLLGLIFFQLLKLKVKYALVGLLIFTIFFTVSLPLAILQDSSARYRWTSILDEGAILKINELRGQSKMPPFISRLIYNKASYFLTESINNYISHFNPKFLFITGGSNFQFSVPGFGLFPSIFLPLFLWGVWLIYQKKENWMWVFLGWLLIAPIPAAITRDSPHALRSLMLIPPITVLIALPVYEIVKKRNKIIILLGFLAILTSLILFWLEYSGNYRKNYSWSFQYGYKEAIEYLMYHETEYNKIYITKKYGEPHEFFLFYKSFNPELLHKSENVVRYMKSDWYWVDQIEKYFFVNDWEIMDGLECAKGKCLLITSPDNYPDSAKHLKRVHFLDNAPAFDIVEL